MDTTAVSTLQRTAVNPAQSLQRISSGQRINKAADDPAGLAIAAELSSATHSERAAGRNINDAMSVVQTAEGATATTTDALMRMRELAVAASSGTLGADGRAALQDEFSQLQQHIDSTAANTEFNGQALVDGTRGSIDVQVGGESGDQMRMDMPDLTGGSLGVAALDLSSSGNARAALDQIDAAIGEVSSARSELGASHSRLESAASLGQSRVEAQEASRSRIEDADYAKLAAQHANVMLQRDAGIAAAVQSRGIERTAVLGLL